MYEDLARRLGRAKKVLQPVGLTGGRLVQREAHLVLRQLGGSAEGPGHRVGQAATPVERHRQQHLAPRPAHVLQDDVPLGLFAHKVNGDDQNELSPRPSFLKDI